MKSLLILLIFLIPLGQAWAQTYYEGQVTVNDEGEIQIHFPKITDLSSQMTEIVDRLQGVKKDPPQPNLGQKIIKNEIYSHDDQGENKQLEKYQIQTASGQNLDITVISQINDRKTIELKEADKGYRFELHQDLLPLITQNPMLVKVEVKNGSLHMDDGILQQIVNATYLGESETQNPDENCMRTIRNALENTAYSDQLLADFIKLQKQITYHKLAYAYFKLDGKEQGMEKLLHKFLKEKYGTKYAALAKDFDMIKNQDPEQAIFLMMAIEGVKHILQAPKQKWPEKLQLNMSDIKTIALFNQKHLGVNFIKMVDQAYADPNNTRVNQQQLHSLLDDMLKKMEGVIKGLIHVACFDPEGLSCQQSAAKVDRIFQDNLTNISSMMLDALFRKEEEYFSQMD